MRRIADIAREVLGTAPGTRDRRVSAILALTIIIIINNNNKGKEKLSYRGLIKHFGRHPHGSTRVWNRTPERVSG